MVFSPDISDGDVILIQDSGIRHGRFRLIGSIYIHGDGRTGQSCVSGAIYFSSTYKDSDSPALPHTLHVPVAREVCPEQYRPSGIWRSDRVLCFQVWY
jgi:hypothetical protein